VVRFFCPSCGSVKESEKEMLVCEKCMEDMLKIEEEFTELLKGKEIVAVALKPIDGEEAEKSFEKNEKWVKHGLLYDGGRIYLIFKDGSMLEAWNSEWGGIDYIEIRKEKTND